MSNNKHGVFGVTLPEIKTEIDEEQLKWARNITDLMAVVYPEVERIFRTKYEERQIDKRTFDEYLNDLDRLKTNVMFSLTKLGSWLYCSPFSGYCMDDEHLGYAVEHAIHVAADLVQFRLKFEPIKLSDVMSGYRDSCIILEEDEDEAR